MWRTAIAIGVFWEGPQFELKPRRWKWMALACARMHLLRFPLRRAIIVYDGEASQS